MGSNYRRGADFERRVREDLAKYGWVSVRAAGSHTPADVYAFRHGDMSFIQCKRNGRLYPDEWNELLDYCKIAGAVPVMAMAGENGRGVRYMRLIGRKEGKGRQPMEAWSPEGSHDEVQEPQA